MPETIASYELIVAAWRRATGLADLDVFVEQLAGLMGPLFRGDSLCLWRVSREGRRTVLGAAATLRRGVTLPAADRELTEGATRAWRDLSELGRAIVIPPEGRGPFHALFAGSGDGSGLAVPLRDSGSLLAALVLWGDGGPCSEEQRGIFEQLAGPVEAALRLHNERHQAAREREALAADRQALLQRLDRDDIGENLVGADSGLRQVVARTEQVAPTDAPVLLLGETGVGKEVVARAIHRRSRRADAPIVRVNCGAIPQGLIDSELFGHEKGAFTGAIATRKGWFERADGGTLFLDEIGELPLEAQVRLLRILQDGVFERVGAQRSHRVDVRIVAATHRDLGQMVQERRFREDLWYRLNVFPIRIPPLRERPEDIPALAAHFAARAGLRIGGKALDLDPREVDLLTAYHWPGNVRELAAVVERAVILGDGRRVHLAAALGGPAMAPPAAEPGDLTIVPLNEAMARHIERALQACGGQVEGRDGAAALLRINPHTLRSRMRKLRIDVQGIRARTR